MTGLRFVLTPLLLSLLVSLGGCFVTRAEGDQIQSDLDEMRSEFFKMRKAQADTEQEVSGKLTEVVERLRNTEKAGSSSVLERDRLAEEIRGLRGRLEEAEHRMSQVASQNEAMEKAAEKEKEKEKEKAAERASLYPPEKQKHLAMAKALFEAKDCEKALPVLSAYVEKHSDDGSAHFMKAECLFMQAKKQPKEAQKDLFKKAVLSYQEVITKYPSSATYPEALFKVGQSLDAMGFRDDAKVFYEEANQAKKKAGGAKPKEKDMSALGAQASREFFDVICDVFCGGQPRLANDDEIFASAMQAVGQSPNELLKVKGYVRLLCEVHESGYFAGELLSRVSIAGIGKKEADVLRRLYSVEKALLEKGLATHTMRKCWALGALKQLASKPRADPFKLPHSVDSLRVDNAFDLNPVEIELLIALASLGLRVEILLPIDEHARGLNAALHQVASRIERRHDLNTLELCFEPFAQGGIGSDVANTLFSDNVFSKECRNKVHIVLAQNVRAEAESVAKVLSAMSLAHMQASAPSQSQPIKVGVVFGVLDHKSDLFRRVFEAQGFSVAGVARRSLLETPAAQLLLHCFYCVDSFAPESRKRALLKHPALVAVPGKTEKGGELLAVLKECIPEQATFIEFLDIADDLVKRHIQQEPRFGAPVLLGWLDKLRHAGQASELNRLAFVRIVEQLLKEEAMPYEAAGLADSNPKPEVQVALTRLDEFDGAYDVVVFADMVNGRWPTQRDQSVFVDEERAAVNQAAGQAIFNMPYNDEHEPGLLPAAFAKDALNLLVASRCAKAHIVFSSSLKDSLGKDELPSLFFRAAQVAMGLDVERFSGTDTSLRLEPNALEKRVLGLELSSVDVEKRLLFEQAKHERRAFFVRAAKGEAAIQPFAFFVGQDTLLERFSKLLGFSATKSLSPTRVEALAECHFRGFLRHFLKVNVEAPRPNDTDARVLGRLAHAVLESFFKAWTQMADMTDRPRFDQDTKALFVALFETEARAFAKEFGSGQAAVYAAHVDFLRNALMRLVSNTIDELAETQGHMKAFEARFDAVPIAVGPHTLFFGGIVDRVDESDTTLSIVDYKMGSADSIAMKSGRRALMQSHFQLPLYMRFLHAQWPDAKDKVMAAKLVSIKDGSSGPVMGGASDVDMCARVCDDTRDDGLSAALWRVLGPLTGGSIGAKPGAYCSTCELKFVCRMPS